MTTRTRWGRARFGGTASLLIVSVVAGALVSSGIGAAFALARQDSEPLLAFAVVVAITLPVSFIGSWALLVDRSTVIGALERPDDSVENVWIDKASAGAFGDLIISLGLALIVFSILDVQLDVGTTLLIILLVAMADVAIRYFWLKKAAS